MYFSYDDYMTSALISLVASLYKGVAKPVLFTQDPEKVHLRALSLGQYLGNSEFAKNTLSSVLKYENRVLEQNLFGITFKNPFGLAAGFDYEARLTQILPSIGFGFGTVGTLTNLPYEGNPRPMLGRLPKSRSLMVNKGFKNFGVRATLENLKGLHFEYPVGVSIGKTNTDLHKTREEAVLDIFEGFKNAEESRVPFSYYELNISCPNLKGSIEFYEPGHLDELLREIARIAIARPIFIKMPISKTDAEIRGMMEVITQYPKIKAVILGNLERNRSNPALREEEVQKFPQGNFSGLPCQKRSDELIAQVYKEFGAKIKIIGCGGIFSAEDSYRKIKRGASLVQLITGLVFEGPQLVSHVNRAFADFLKRDGYSSIHEAIGTYS